MIPLPLIGALVGAGVGALTNKDNRLKGALLGAGTGAGLGFGAGQIGALGGKAAAAGAAKSLGDSVLPAIEAGGFLPPTASPNGPKIPPMAQGMSGLNSGNALSTLRTFSPLLGSLLAGSQQPQQMSMAMPVNPSPIAALNAGGYQSQFRRNYA